MYGCFYFYTWTVRGRSYRSLISWNLRLESGYVGKQSEDDWRSLLWSLSPPSAVKSSRNDCCPAAVSGYMMPVHLNKESPQYSVRVIQVSTAERARYTAGGYAICKKVRVSDQVSTYNGCVPWFFQASNLKIACPPDRPYYRPQHWLDNEGIPRGVIFRRLFFLRAKPHPDPVK